MMRMLVLALAVQLVPGMAGEVRGHDVFACLVRNKGWAAGTKLPPSGLFYRWADGAWSQRGLNHPDVQAIDFDPRNPRVVWIATGNGCWRSADAGRTWALTTGEDVTELRDISVDPHRPGEVYIALPDGVAVTRDGGRVWKRLELGVKRPYTKAIRVDRTRAGRVLAATEQGILLSDNAGAAWRMAGRGAMVTSLEQSPGDPARWLATTESSGLLTSGDGGRSWSRVEGIPMDHSLYNAAFDATRPDCWAVASWDAGVLVSEDGGKTWAARNQGLPSAEVVRVAFDPGHSGRLWASVYQDALFVSGDAGRHWRKDGFDGAVVNALAFMPRVTPGFRGRVEEVIGEFADPPDPSSAGYLNIAARLKRGHGAGWTSRRLIELLREPAGDMFWMMPVTAIAYLGRGQLTPEAEAALRTAWKTYMPYRGDTENHWLMYYSCLYLMAQLWPDLPAGEWFNRKSSAQNRAEAERYLGQWMELTLTKGQGEYDCTHYFGVYMAPLSYLMAWAQDAGMRQRARMMLEWMMVDYAADNLGGLYVGAHARADDRNILEKWYTVGSEFGWLLFGLGYPMPSHGYAALYYAVSSAYQPPEVIRQIATDRSRDYVERELKRTRNRWRFQDVRNAAVHKTTYMRRDYAVGSDEGGLWQPIQQHSWDVTWAVPDPRGVHNTIFSMHPRIAAGDLQTYYTKAPDWAIQSMLSFRPTYASADKLLGGSPFEQVFQDRDTVVALYDIAEGTQWGHINGFFSKDLARLEEDPSGWIFCQGGNAYIAYRPLAPYEWKPIEGGGRRLFSLHRKNGTVIQVASASEVPSFAAFRQAILALPFEARLEPVPSVKMKTLRGSELSFTWGQPRDWSGWKLFDSPYLACDRKVLRIQHDQMRRVLDFNRWTIDGK